jgi:hypothetical protein
LHTLTSSNRCTRPPSDVPLWEPGRVLLNMYSPITSCAQVTLGSTVWQLGQLLVHAHAREHPGGATCCAQMCSDTLLFCATLHALLLLQEPLVNLMRLAQGTNQGVSLIQ